MEEVGAVRGAAAHVVTELHEAEGDFRGRRVKRLYAVDIQKALDILNNPSTSLEKKQKAIRDLQQHTLECEPSMKTDVQKVIEECLQGIAPISDKEKAQKQIHLLTAEVSLLEKLVADGERAAVHEKVQKLFRARIEELFHPSLPKEIEQAVATNPTVLEGYKKYLQALPLAQALFDRHTEEEREALRATYTDEEKHLIEEAVSFAWNNAALNDYLHRKPLLTRSEEFFHDLSYLKEGDVPQSADMDRLNECLQKSGLGQLMDSQRGLEELEKKFESEWEKYIGLQDYKIHVSNEEEVRCIQLIQRKPYLPFIDQALDERRIQAMQRLLDLWKTRGSKAGNIQTALRSLLDKSREFKVAAESLEQKQRAIIQIEKEWSKIKKLSPNSSKDRLLQKQIQACQEMPLGSSPTQAKLQQAKTALSNIQQIAQKNRSPYGQAVTDQLEELIGMFDHVQGGDEKVPQLQPVVFHRAAQCVELWGEGLKQLFGVQSVFSPYLPEAGKDKYKNDPTPAAQKLYQVQQVVQRGYDICQKERQAIGLFRSTLPGDLSFTHSDYAQLVRGKHKKEGQSELLTRLVKKDGHFMDYVISRYTGTYGHADLVFAAEQASEYMGLFRGESGVVSNLIEAQFIVAGTRYRPDLYSCLSDKAKRALQRKWNIDEEGVKRRLYEKQAECMHEIATGTPDPATKKKKTTFQDIRNTKSHAIKAFLHSLIPAFLLTLASLVASCFRAIFHIKTPVGYQAPLIRKPTDRDRVMFCSEFAAAVLQTVQHDVEEWLKQELEGDAPPIAKPFEEEIIPVDAKLASFFPEKLRQHVRKKHFVRVEESPASRLLFGPRRLLRSD